MFSLSLNHFQGYRDQIRSEEMASLVPPGLHGKEDVLFGNLNELYTFHSDVFLKDLENCISTTELVALCFVQRVISIYFDFSWISVTSKFGFSSSHSISAIRSIVCIHFIAKIFRDRNDYVRLWSIRIYSCKNVRSGWATSSRWPPIC